MESTSTSSLTLGKGYMIDISIPRICLNHYKGQLNFILPYLSVINYHFLTGSWFKAFNSLWHHLNSQGHNSAGCWQYISRIWNAHFLKSFKIATRISHSCVQNWAIFNVVKWFTFVFMWIFSLSCKCETHKLFCPIFYLYNI